LVTQDDFVVRFWGVRGSIACPGEATARYGGNTACVEMRCGDRLLIFDAGTGLRLLGNALDDGAVVDADHFFSHSHFDHIIGLPFFCPAYKPENRFEVWAGHLNPDFTIEQALRLAMQAPLFPVPLDVFKAEMNFHDFSAGATLEPRAGIRVRTAALNHPDGATGYRVEYGGKSVCYVTDTEHVMGAPDQNILALIADADIVIYDSTYTDEEFETYINWGHSTWQEGVRLCQAASVGTLVIFHHDPGHDDATMDRIADEAATAFPGAIVAREGMILNP
jgi:phosphoribosyl 1,2-cyclic phosphodiesterase